MNEIASSDLTSRDFSFAFACTFAVFVAASFALSHARLEHHAELPAIDPGSAIPIAVRPVADIGPMGKKRAGAKKKTSRKRKSSRTKSEPTSEPVPDAAAEPVPSAWQRTPRNPVKPQPTPLPDVAPPADPAEPPAEEPDPTQTPEDPAAADPDPEVDASPDDPDQAGAGGEPGDTGTGSAETGSGVGGGGTEPGGEGEGDGDPLLERAIAFYRARLVAWFASRFRVTGSGLSPEQLAKYRVRARIDIGEDLRIVGFKVLSSDHPAFDAAARTTLDALRGETLPPPPENYPGAVQRQLTVSFTCTEDACD